MAEPDANAAQRIELVLQQIEALPTLPEVAMRLLQVTTAEDSDAQQVIDLVKTDPALSAKILQLCRSAANGLRTETLTVDRAVVLLGFDAVRNAVLSVKVFEAFTDPAPAGRGSGGHPPWPDAAGDEPPSTAFDRRGFWRHSLAVAVAAELIARQHAHLDGVVPAEAFICGLMHDIGKLALDHVLPKSYARVVDLTESSHANIAHVERKVLGIDHHTAGKRLAEQWGLGHAVADAIWLHGAAPGSIPDLEHGRLVGLVGLADLHARRQHLGYSGNHRMNSDADALAEAIGLDPDRVRQAADALHDELEKRVAALGVGAQPSRRLFLDSIMQANEKLGALNGQLETHKRRATRQTRALAAIRDFHAAAVPSRTVADVLSAVAGSALSTLGPSHYALIYQATGASDWQVSQFNREGRVVRSQLVDPPTGMTKLSELDAHSELSVRTMSLLPWLSDYLCAFDDLRKVKLLPLPCAWGMAAVLVHDQPELPEPEHLDALVHTWGAAIAAATQHEGARRLGEQLAEANRTLTETQESLLAHQSMARLGEMAAGAAHEMNNPLAVISGRAQLLATTLEAGTKERADAELVCEQAQKLSDLITAMHLFAEPPQPRVQPTTIEAVMARAVERVRQRMPEAPAVEFNPPARLPTLRTDLEHLASVFAELMCNAHEAEPETGVRVTAQVDPLDDRFIVQVTDDGHGMDPTTAEHAFDPFFSRKPAGRRTGLGLARAQRLMEGLGGRVELRSEPERGTTATVELPLASSGDEDDPVEYSAAPQATSGAAVGGDRVTEAPAGQQ